MATLNFKIPGADELAIIRYLLDEIEEERFYNDEYKKAEIEAKKKADENPGRRYWEYFDYNKFPHAPRESVIKDNAKMIRRLLLKIRG